MEHIPLDFSGFQTHSGAGRKQCGRGGAGW